MASTTWKGSGSVLDSWNIGANWTLRSVPGAADAAILPSVGSYPVTIGAASTDTVQTLTLNAPKTGTSATTALNVQGHLVVKGAISGTGGIINLQGGSLEVGTSSLASTAVYFRTGGTDRLILDTVGDLKHPADTTLFASLLYTDPGGKFTVDLAPGSYKTGVTYSIKRANQYLTVSDNAGHTISQFRLGHNRNYTFTLSNDGGRIGINATVPVCFAAGTRILGDGREIAVEDLRAGDLVRTGTEAALRPVRWIGWTSVDLDSFPDPGKARPIRIRRHAFAENRPHRDLLVSPDHAILADGVLIPAKLLVNGATIVQETRAGAIEYFHVELDSHDVLLAEGLPAESYLDTGNRAMFANAGVGLAMHPRFALNAALRSWALDACAPLSIEGAALTAVKRGLLERAALLGYTLTDDFDLRLLAGGRIVRPASSENGICCFALPPGVSGFRIATRATAAADTVAEADDRRRLGIAVSRIVLRDGRDYLDIPLDHPALIEGWHGPERGESRLFRWTDGDAYVPLDTPAATMLVHIQITGSLRYWADPADRADPATERQAA